MQVPAQALTLTLRKSQFIRLAQPRGVRLAVSSGYLWLTIDGQPRDIELAPGAHFEFGADDSAPALIGVLGDGAVFSAQAAAACAARPLALALGPACV